MDYLRSFKVVGDKANTCKFFKENYIPTSIFKNWKAIDGKGVNYGPSQWTFNTNPTKYGLAVRQNSLVQGTDFNYGSVLINKNFDCSDALFKANVYFETVGQASLVFRYYDENNYYSLEMNVPGAQRLRLVKKNEGIGEAIGGSPRSLCKYINNFFLLLIYWKN